MQVYSVIRCKNLINGEMRESTNDDFIKSINPATGELVGLAPNSQIEVAREAIESARTAIDRSDWSRSPVARSKALYSLSEAMVDNYDALVNLLIRDAGKTVSDSKLEIDLCCDTVEYYAGLARNVYGRTIDLSPTATSFLVREPLGVIGIITPWNWPLLLLLRSLAPALAAGNAVVIKPASLTPVVNYKFIDVLQSTHMFPSGIVNYVTGPGPVVGTEIVRNENVDMISFTGETVTGKEILKLGAESIKRVSLELGGKSPNIVFEDAPFEKSIRAALKGAFLTAGQVCFAGSRLLVQDSVHDSFVKKATELAKQMKVGYGLSPSIEIGPLISKTQLDSVMEYVKDGKKHSKLVTGGEVLTEGELSKGFFVSPTIFDDVPTDSKIAKEEIFGPVLSVIPFKSDDEAIAIANDSKYGLAAAIWTANLNRALGTARKIKAGTVWINTYGKNYAPAEFGGFRQSGLGRVRGLSGLYEFTEMKNINVDTAREF
jgi:betaine-aldehyde dehydrogenase